MDRLHRSNSNTGLVEVPLDDLLEAPSKDLEARPHLQLERVEMDPLIFSIYQAIFEWIAFVFSQIYTSLVTIYESIVDLTKTNSPTSPNPLSIK